MKKILMENLKKKKVLVLVWHFSGYKNPQFLFSSDISFKKVKPWKKILKFSVNSWNFERKVEEFNESMIRNVCMTGFKSKAPNLKYFWIIGHFGECKTLTKQIVLDFFMQNLWIKFTFLGLSNFKLIKKENQSYPCCAVSSVCSELLRWDVKTMEWLRRPALTGEVRSICDETQTNVCFWNAFLLVSVETTHSFIFIAFWGLWAIYFNLFWNIVQFYSAVDLLSSFFFDSFFFLEKQTCLHGCLCFRFIAVMNFYL